ncbi:26262_t:CDS:2, partial [Racocetra persica]
MSDLQLGKIFYDHSHGKYYVENNLDWNPYPTKESDNASLMFWTCFSWYRLGPIVSIRGNVNGEAYVRLLKEHAIPAIQRLVPNGPGIFQQDSASPHRYWKAKETLKKAGISILPWLAQSPDMNPMENMWHEVKRRLHNSPDKPTSIDDLEEKVIAAWYSIPYQYYRDV